MSNISITQQDKKRCNKCGYYLPYSGFNKSGQTKDGYRTTCRHCDDQVPSKSGIRQVIQNNSVILFIDAEPATIPINGYQNIDCPRDCNDCELSCGESCDRWQTHVCSNCPCLESREVKEYLFEINLRRRLN